jgi:Chaperone of endosialidase
MNPLTHSKNTTILPVLIALTLACFALGPTARAVCQDGCLTNENTVLGDSALFHNTGSFNTAIGYIALASNTTGITNTAVGSQALSVNTTGNFNTATGFLALYHNNADNNTASGASALENNTTGVSNTAVGYIALISNTTGNDNTANGAFALDSNTTGNNNTANGFEALEMNTTGVSNTATGAAALDSNTTGINNTATGVNALFNNKAGQDNIAEGFSALENNTTGSSNIALGSSAGFNITGSNNIDIGNVGTADESGHIRIGTNGTHKKAFIAGISGAAVPGGVGMIVGTNGQLGTAVSSARFKEAVKPMGNASEAILALKPVTFRYKKELDPDGISQFGLVAEEVEKINPDLVARDEQGKPYTVRYEAVNAMLLNEFLKARRQIDAQQKQIDALSAALPKVSTQLATGRVRVAAATGLERSKSAPQTACLPAGALREGGNDR